MFPSSVEHCPTRGRKEKEKDEKRKKKRGGRKGSGGSRRNRREPNTPRYYETLPGVSVGLCTKHPFAPGSRSRPLFGPSSTRPRSSPISRWTPFANSSCPNYELTVELRSNVSKTPCCAGTRTSASRFWGLSRILTRNRTSRKRSTRFRGC